MNMNDTQPWYQLSIYRETADKQLDVPVDGLIMFRQDHLMVGLFHYILVAVTMVRFS